MNRSMLRLSERIAELEAELVRVNEDRARKLKALRIRAIMIYSGFNDPAVSILPHSRCEECNARWALVEDERHNEVNGKPCPAALEVEK